MTFIYNYIISGSIKPQFTRMAIKECHIRWIYLFQTKTHTYVLLVVANKNEYLSKLIVVMCKLIALGVMWNLLCLM